VSELREAVARQVQWTNGSCNALCEERPLGEAHLIPALKSGQCCSPKPLNHESTNIDLTIVVATSWGLCKMCTRRLMAGRNIQEEIGSGLHFVCAR